MTLVECLGALAVIALLAAVLVPVAIRHLDQIARDQEGARLKQLGDALQASILRNCYIPAATNWASVVATEAGVDVGTVTSNARGRPRIFLVDASGWMYTNYPYTQTATGTPTAPLNARVLLVSSIAGPDPPLSSGMPYVTDFANLWNVPAGTVPQTGAWAGWGGRAEDVKIQRVNLSPLFVKLVLGTYNSNSNGQYTINVPAYISPYYEAPKSNGVSAYYLQGSVLNLYKLSNNSSPSTNVLDATQILTRDSSFVFEGGVWKGSIQGGVTFGLGDISGIVAAFLAATPNTNAMYYTNTVPNTQQVFAVQTMIDYMSNYDRWASNGFSDNTLKDYLCGTLQPNMMKAINGLYNPSYGGNNYYPTNGIACP